MVENSLILNIREVKVYTSLKYETYDFVVWNEMKWTIIIHRKIEQELDKVHVSDELSDEPYQKCVTMQNTCNQR